MGTIKLAIYSFTVRCPDTWDDEDWPQSKSRKLDDIAKEMAARFNAAMKRRIDSDLTLELND